MIDREKIIQEYIQAYNQLDIDRMLACFDDNVVFENISDGTVTLYLEGLAAFGEQAEKAKGFFTERKQTIKGVKHQGDESIVDIDYYGILAMDFPNGLKKGEKLNLSGTSVFRFSVDKIIRLTDIS